MPTVSWIRQLAAPLVLAAALACPAFAAAALPTGSAPDAPHSRSVAAADPRDASRSPRSEDAARVADGFADALEIALTIAWNSEQSRVRFSEMACHRAGRIYGEAAFVCRSLYTIISTEKVRCYRFTVLPDGEVVASKRLW